MPTSQQPRFESNHLCHSFLQLSRSGVPQLILHPSLWKLVNSSVSGKALTLVTQYDDGSWALRPARAESGLDGLAHPMYY